VKDGTLKKCGNTPRSAQSADGRAFLRVSPLDTPIYKRACFLICFLLSTFDFLDMASLGAGVAAVGGAIPKTAGVTFEK
jgi:hypothetical protein